MTTKKIITTNGKKEVIINSAPFDVAYSLWSECSKVLKTLDLDIKKGVSVKEIITAIVDLQTSDLFNEKLFKCMELCKYDNFHAFNKDFLNDNPEAVQDFYEIAKECIMVNVSPFAKSLLTLSSTQADN